MASTATFSPHYSSPYYDHHDHEDDEDYMSSEDDAEDDVVGGRSSDNQSVYSYSSSIDRHLILKNIHGRTFNNTNEVRLLCLFRCDHLLMDLCSTTCYPQMWQNTADWTSNTNS